MPRTLKLFVVVSSACLLLALLLGQWVSVLVTGALVAVAIEARYEGRTDALVVVRLTTIAALVVVGIGIADLVAGDLAAGAETLAGGLLALVPAALYRWCVDQVEVLRWMLHRRSHQTGAH